MTVDVFQAVRERVTAPEAAQAYGLEVNRTGFCCCPFHGEKNPSMKLFQDDRGFYCFGCHKGGSVIDLVAGLLGLDPLEAVRRLNEDFRLGLDLDHKPDKKALQEAQRRRETAATYQMFEEWRVGLINRLNACFRVGHLAMKAMETPSDLDRLTEAQALAIREQARFAWLADTLSWGAMAEKMEIFRQRREVGSLCEMILKNLKNTPLGLSGTLRKTG